MQTKFAPIIHPFINNHCVGAQVSDTKLWAAFFKQVIVSQVVAIGVVGGLNIGVLNEGIGMESRNQVMPLLWLLSALKSLQIE